LACSEPWQFTPNAQVDLSAWVFAVPTAITLMSAVISTYLLFSPIGLANGTLGSLFWALIAALVAINALVWARLARRA